MGFVVRGKFEETSSCGSQAPLSPINKFPHYYIIIGLKELPNSVMEKCRNLHMCI